VAYDLTTHIRRVVDPLLMKLRAELYGGSSYNTTLVETLIPTGVIETVIQEQGGTTVVPPYKVYSAGSNGVTAGRALVYDGTHAHNADCLTSGHAGQIIGVARADASAFEDVQVQIYGELDLPATFSFADQGTLFVGISGQLVRSPDTGTTFIQAVGTSLTTTKMHVNIQASPIIV
jgi:hypothetical protein